VPLGDAESLERLRERIGDAATHPAGSTALVDADIPSAGDAEPGQEPAGQDAFVYFNNDGNAYAVRNARTLQALLASDGASYPGIFPASPG
jgi:uncharacterized protein YecE (DUF72 family)